MRRWVRLIPAVGACQDKTSDLVLCALVRARFGELLAPLTHHGESDLFLLGLLSMLDIMLDMPMSEVLEKISLDSETKAVLRGEPSLLRPVYQLMLAHESGEWGASRGICDSLHIDADTVAASLAVSTMSPRSFQRSMKPEARPPLQNFRQWPLVQNPSVLPLACALTDEYH
ncbi:MAG: hypothetical protein WBP65_10655 [Candidatus Sulfotelmatobacter sp.]